MRAILSEHEDNQTELQSGLNDHTEPRNSRAEPSHDQARTKHNANETSRCRVGKIHLHGRDTKEGKGRSTEGADLNSTISGVTLTFEAFLRHIFCELFLTV